MATTSKLGFGTILQVEDKTTPGTFKDIALITSVKPPGVSADVVDRTTMASVNGFRQKMGGLKAWGQTSVNCHYDPTDAVVADLISRIGKTVKHKIKFPDDTTLSFDAVVVSFEPGEVTMDGLMTATYTADVDGEASQVPVP